MLKTTIRFAAANLAQLEANITNSQKGWGTVARVSMSDPDTGITFDDAGSILSNGERFFYATPRRTWTDKDNKPQAREQMNGVTPVIREKILAQFNAMVEAKGEKYREVLGVASANENAATFTL
jgi:hypothetical protein